MIKNCHEKRQGLSGNIIKGWVSERLKMSNVWYLQKGDRQQQFRLVGNEMIGYRPFRLYGNLWKVPESFRERYGQRGRIFTKLEARGYWKTLRQNGFRKME
jgi:hypothetical protein